MPGCGQGPKDAAFVERDLVGKRSRTHPVGAPPDDVLIGAQAKTAGERLDVGGAFSGYQMGAPVWQELTWPGEDPAAGAALRAQMGDGPAAQSLNHPGPWGLFRLLDEATLDTILKDVEAPFFDRCAARFGWHRSNKALLEAAGLMSRRDRMPMPHLNDDDFESVRAVYTEVAAAIDRFYAS